MIGVSFWINLCNWILGVALCLLRLAPEKSGEQARWADNCLGDGVAFGAGAAGASLLRRGPAVTA